MLFKNISLGKCDFIIWWQLIYAWSSFQVKSNCTWSLERLIPADLGSIIIAPDLMGQGCAGGVLRKRGWGGGVSYWMHGDTQSPFALMTLAARDANLRFPRRGRGRQTLVGFSLSLHPYKSVKWPLGKYGRFVNTNRGLSRWLGRESLGPDNSHSWVF